MMTFMMIISLPHCSVVTPILTLPSVINSPSDVLDMPVDPNEPTYCLCHQVSYGEMIGCDNPDVSIVLKYFILKETDEEYLYNIGWL